MKLANNHHSNPSDLESLIIAHLNEHPHKDGITWAFEVVKERWIVDFVFYAPSGREIMYLELNGFVPLEDAQVPAMVLLKYDLVPEHLEATMNDVYERLSYLLECPF